LDPYLHRSSYGSYGSYLFLWFDRLFVRLKV
jgi:hypothetical protein